MKNLFLCFIALLITNLSVSAQNDTCRTKAPNSTWFDRQPYYGNNQYLYSLFDSLQIARGGANTVPKKYNKSKWRLNHHYSSNSRYGLGIWQWD
jgi:hypothetical protein